MKKTLSIILISMLVLSFFVVASSAAEPIKLGKVEYPAHGTKAFTIAIVALQGDTIVAAYLDEYQFMAKDSVIGVPCSDELGAGDFGSHFANPETTVLGSKRVNNEYYSNNMAKKAGSTVSLVDNYAAIEAFAIGKTVAELEAIVTKSSAAELIDAVTSATLVDTKGYLEALLEAAKSAQ